MYTDIRLGTLAEEYHIASRHQSGLKHLVKAHLTHYSPFVEKLEQEAPLHLSGYPRIQLPEIQLNSRVSLDEVIVSRSSGRNFTSLPLSPEQLARMLYLGNAVRQVEHRGQRVHYLRNVPNSGNLGSVEIYPVVMNVVGFDPGIYHYDSVSHDLAQLRRGQYSTWLREFVFFQLEFSLASVALILTSAVGRLSAKYGLRGYRLALLDIGHVSQNIYLAATAAGHQVCATAGFIDDELDRVLDVDGLETATMLAIMVGP